jgi:hypothetical protein
LFEELSLKEVDMIRNNFTFISTGKTTSDGRKIILIKFVRLFIVFIFLVLAVHTQTVSAQTFESSLLTDLSKTLGFIMGQHSCLDLIKAEYPNPQSQAKFHSKSRTFFHS